MSDAMRRGRLSGEAGATLVEVLVGMVILGVIGTMTIGGILAVSRTQQASSVMQEEMDQTRLAHDRIRRELREAKRVFEDPTGFHLQMWQDRDGNTEIEASEIVHFRLAEDGDAAILESWTGDNEAGRSVLARNLVYAPPFEYIGEEPPGTTLVGVSIAARANDRRPAPLRLTAEVRLRNVSTN